jgi:GR25 family glycosyltransferase involved in LPS biosynthesis
MENTDIDFNTYWINLDRCNDRKKNMELFFNKFHIKNKRISAIDGSIKDIFNNYVIFKDNKIIEKEKNCQLACLLSHLITIRGFYENDPNDYCLILEDDIDFQVFFNYNLNLKKTINKIIRECKENWEIIQLSYTVRKNKQFKSDPFNLYTSWKDSYYGTIAYIINKKAALKLINNNFNGNKIFIDLTNEKKNNYYVADYLLYHEVKTLTYKIPIFIYNKNFKTIIGSKTSAQVSGIIMLHDSIKFYDVLLKFYPKN